MTVKTTLVEGVPWPPKDAKVDGRPKALRTDENFEKWEKKDALVTGAKLGLSIKEEIKQRLRAKK